MRDLVIIGGGPAGLTAAIYAGRSMRKPLVIAGQAIGGQLGMVSEIENYPGFPDGINGAELASLLQKQAERFETEFVLDFVTSVDFSGKSLLVSTNSDEIEARAVIIATGTSRSKLGVPGEEEFIGRGVSYCATCDGFFYRGKTVAVVGGGNSALQEALELTHFVEKVYIVHRRSMMRADSLIVERALAHPKIEVLWRKVVDRIQGDQTVQSLRLCDAHDRASEEELAVEGIFIYIGTTPNTEFLGGAVEMDERGHLIVDPFGRTNVRGVYAAGDCRKNVLEQVVIAAGSGALAAMSAQEYLDMQEGHAPPPREGRVQGPIRGQPPVSGALGEEPAR
jgi:thioredoxin reductase (NADPH)